MQSHETIQVTIVKSSLIQSSLPIPPFLGLAKKRRFSETAVLGGSITFKWAAVLGMGRDDFTSHPKHCASTSSSLFLL